MNGCLENENSCYWFVAFRYNYFICVLQKIGYSVVAFDKKNIIEKFKNNILPIEVNHQFDQFLKKTKKFFLIINLKIIKI